MHDPESLVRAALALLNEHDVEGYVDMCADDFVMTSELGRFTGKAELRAALSPFADIPDHWRTIERIEVDGGSVSVWLRFGGTFASTGRAFEMDGCTVWTVRDGLLSSATEHGSYQPAIDASRPAPD